MIHIYLIADHLCCLTKVSLCIESDNLLQRVSYQKIKRDTGCRVSTEVSLTIKITSICWDREGGEIRMWNMWEWELNSKGLALLWPSECVEKEARREQVVSWVETRAGKILHLCSAQHQSCPHASVFKSYSYAPNCLTSLSSDAVFVVQALLDCLTVHQSASIVLHCIKESTPFILGWLHSIEIPRVGLAL